MSAKSEKDKCQCML